MLKVMTNSSTIKVSLSLTAHTQAKKFSCHQFTPAKAKQVYLNTLAIYAVHNYLNYLGWKTSLETSDSWNPLLQTLMNVADLDLPEYGKLECRFVLPDANWVEIPAEVRTNRIAYVIVQLEKSLKQSILLGFVSTVKSSRLALTQLQPIEHLSHYLSKQKQVSQLVKLSRWLEGIVETGWQRAGELSTPTIATAFRSFEQLQKQQKTLLSGVSRFKILELNTPFAQDDLNHRTEKVSIALILNLSFKSSNQIDISVKVYPVNHHTHLPEGLEITVLDREEIPVMQAQANKTETIEFCFSGEEGEYFSIKASLNDCHSVETFVI
jgi:hypothetical protein